MPGYYGAPGRDGRDGAKGERGSQGRTGSLGPPGAKGKKGDKRETGAQGPAGQKMTTRGEGRDWNSRITSAFLAHELERMHLEKGGWQRLRCDPGK